MVQNDTLKVSARILGGMASLTRLPSLLGRRLRTAGGARAVSTYTDLSDEHRMIRDMARDVSRWWTRRGA
jgi:hypothetical protein